MKNKNIVIAYLVVTLILLSEIILNLNKYSYAGYYSDKIIGWLWLAMTVFIIIKLWKKKAVKVYFGLLVGAIILSILPMMIPFFGIVNYFSTIGSYQRIQLDDHYRIDRNRPNVLYNPQVTIYRREGIVEKQISRIPYNEVLEKVFQCSSIDLPVDDKKENIQRAKLIMANKDSIGIEYQITNKKQIFYHKVNENWFE
ncbi:hypothetical protein EG344_08320 [Chryseobacterium sp. G0162]|uniref:hypothetical protein n=1 Tax=Chryseobacterium sp. G0162 TaxID=2487063 RepID=UPI000F516303|nr:hypothetical protein [Chryseobacterium sp. G0162]AZB08825.1 hypothetical protein EG344_08320 [Chryseobacterium sp. G0162]